MFFSNPQTWHCTEAVKQPSSVAKLRTDAASQEHFGQNAWTIWSFLSGARLSVVLTLSHTVRLWSLVGRDIFVQCDNLPNK